MWAGRASGFDDGPGAGRNRPRLHDLPVHCIHGRPDNAAPLDELLTLARIRPQWRFSVLDDVDHHPWLRCEATCRQLIAGDLNSD